MSSSHLAALPAGQVPQVTTPGSSYKSCRTFSLGKGCLGGQVRSPVCWGPDWPIYKLVGDRYELPPAFFFLFLFFFKEPATPSHTLRFY